MNYATQNHSSNPVSVNIHSHSPEWSPAVSADEALGVELVPHGGDHSVQTRLVAHTADGGGGPLVWAEKIFILWF